MALDENLFRMVYMKVFLLTVLFSNVLSQSCVSPTTKCDCFEDEGKKIINCRYKNLTEIPAFTNTNLVYDEIRFTQFEEAGKCQPSAGCNNITQIGSDAFKNLKVKKIDLLHNAVTTVNLTAFRGLEPELESLSLEGDGSNDMPYSALAELDEHLKSLHLEHYGHYEIKPPIVFPFPNLESLTIKNWENLREIDPDVFSVMTNLAELKLNKLSSLSTLPVAAIQEFLNLTSLDITETGITSVLGDSFKPMSQLNEIKIRNNYYLTSIDRAAFSGVTDTVQYLDLDNNKLNNIESLRNENWIALSHINIGYNNDLRTLPSGIFSKMPTLDYLTCNDIGLTSINKEMFTGLSNLHTLDLAYNQIKTVSTEAFKNSPSLVELRLHDQNINPELINFQENAFGGIETSLEMLNINGNKFNLIQFWNDISKLSELKVLEIVETGIINIPDKAFRNNTKLTTLHMSGNNLTSIKQETFYGPRNTLHTIDLQRNQIQTIDQCTLNDFPIKPKLLLAGNQLNCNCDLVWLYDWFKTQGNQDIVANDIGECTLPVSLANKMFNKFSRNDMCPDGAPVRTCPDLYATTTTSTTTSTSTTTTTTKPTTPPFPQFELTILNQDTTKIEVTWWIPDKTFVTGLRLEMISNDQEKKFFYPGLDATSHTFYQLRPSTSYTFCLVLKIANQYRDEKPDCKPAETVPPITQPTTPRSSTEQVTSKPESQLGVIIGSSVGGVVLIALVIAILVILLRTNKPKKQPKPIAQPVSFTMKAEIPHAGGTARRFAKKPDKEGATPDDIQITTISNGDMNNRDRISAGSYQALNEKGVDPRPMPSSPEHYANSWEERPLPKAPYSSSGATGHGYVNGGFKNGAEKLPETSKNEYSEVRY